ncbi:methyltransferase domain-containing protein [Nocardioides donggukensis]|uniref:Methyltransferase domain-containing protein n=1 Tax=Nocardioides donggukensis TaxID=2774019 RepID=A0A927K7M5_9ACTN|nr:methyltransferase domain-containing protein [Nocardioides donggukensis]MBD8870665.1 methyltransferase domain-containing protein [Nocardioides donggukensis]
MDSTPGRPDQRGTTTPHTWDPGLYCEYAGERGRPFVDLVQRIAAEDPETVLDLGCGPGNLTRLLTSRWPGAAVSGLDSSPEMIEAARAADDRIVWEVGDLRTWAGEPHRVDVVVSNATLQWVPGHLDLLGPLLDNITPTGWLAFQVPGNVDEPSHTLRQEIAEQDRYAAHLAGVAVPSSHDPATYLERLVELGCEVDAWETTYLHVLTGEDPVFTWVSGTGARPTLQALPEPLRTEFATELRERLRAAYPAGPQGVVMPFRRVFVVAHKGTGA